MTFDQEKKEYLLKLGKPDFSKKGGVDDAMWPLLDAINACSNFYTTSSCAGRMCLLEEPENGRKDLAHWPFVTHDKAKHEDITSALNNISPDRLVWFKYEAAILHIVARSEDDANWLLNCARECGFKHSGLLGTKKRYILELFDTEKIDAPIAKSGTLLVSKEYVYELIDLANKKLDVTRERMEKLRRAMIEHENTSHANT